MMVSRWFVDLIKILIGFILANDGLNVFSKILSSAQDVFSAEVPVFLKRIAAKIPKDVNFSKMSDEDAVHYMRISKDEAAKDFRTFLLDYGHRGTKEFDVYADKWEDDPTMLVQSIKAMTSSNRFDFEIGWH